MADDIKKDAFITKVITTKTQLAHALGSVKTSPCLVLINGDPSNIGRSWTLDRPIITLGRAAQSDIHVAVGGLSKSHAQFTREADIVKITDLDSTNKTFVNGHMLTRDQPHALASNDIIQAGNLFFSFRAKGVVAETTENAQMQAEIKSARPVQSSLLPVQVEAKYGSVRIGGRYRSASECSSDWWWHWGNDEKAFAIIGDVTGHGVGAALITSAAHSAVSTIERSGNAKIENVYKALTLALNDCSKGNVVMSAFIVEFGVKNNLLRFINASHLPSVLLPPTIQGPDLSAMALLDCKISPPLGQAFESFTVGTANVRSGMRLVLLTDGITERPSAEGQTIRERQFYKMLVEAHSQQPRNQAQFLDLLLEKSDTQASGAPLKDDITLAAMDFS